MIPTVVSRFENSVVAKAFSQSTVACCDPGLRRPGAQRMDLSAKRSVAYSKAGSATGK